MLVENPFPNDIRVRNEAFTLAKAGYKVAVIASRHGDQGFRDSVNGVEIFRLPRVDLFTKKPSSGSSGPIRRFLGGVKSAIGYATEHAYLALGGLILSLYVAVKHGFDVIHAHNPPDTLFLLGWFYKPFGKKFVFDHHDLSPELYQSRLKASNKFIYNTLLTLEKLSLRASTVSIATNESYKKIQIERGGRRPERVFVVRNGPDLERVHPTDPDPELRAMGKTILAYLGLINPQDGLDYMLRALAKLAFELDRKDFYCVVVGRGDSLADMQRLTVELGLEEYVHFTGYVSEADLIRYLSSADICLDPNPSNPLNDHSTWIKVMEYMAMSKPLVAFDLKETHFSAQDAALYAPPNDELEFARQVARLMDDPELRTRLGEAGYRRIQTELKWDIVSKNLLDAYETLFGHAT